MLQTYRNRYLYNGSKTRQSMVDLKFKLDQQVNKMNLEYTYNKNTFQLNNITYDMKNYQLLLDLLYEFCEENDILWLDLQIIKTETDNNLMKFLLNEGFCVLFDKQNSILTRKKLN